MAAKPKATRKKSRVRPVQKPRTIGLRLSDKRRFELELVSKILPGSPSITGTIEWAIDLAISKTPELAKVPRVWSPHESDRLINTAILYPEALGHEELQIYGFILDLNCFSRPVDGGKDSAWRSFDFALLREVWPLIKDHIVDGKPWNEAAFKKICKERGVTPGPRKRGMQYKMVKIPLNGPEETEQD